jgi:hypothetical protein
MFKFSFSAVNDATERDNNNELEQNLKFQAFEVKPEDDVKVS